jgi:hypothetical protein
VWGFWSCHSSVGQLLVRLRPKVGPIRHRMPLTDASDGASHEADRISQDFSCVLEHTIISVLHFAGSCRGWSCWVRGVSFVRGDDAANSAEKMWSLLIASINPIPVREGRSRRAPTKRDQLYLSLSRAFWYPVEEHSSFQGIVLCPRHVSELDHRVIYTGALNVTIHILEKTSICRWFAEAQRRRHGRLQRGRRISLTVSTK